MGSEQKYSRFNQYFPESIAHFVEFSDIPPKLSLMGDPAYKGRGRLSPALIITVANPILKS